jgi:methyltransferase (TIGR00027 family)
MDSVAKTSLLTAAMRAVESNRSYTEGRLFTDPYAELLAGEEGKELLRKAVTASGDNPAIAVRTFFIDSRINLAFDSGVRQFVFLAAGMDTRVYRMSFPADARVFELDKKKVLDYKRQKLSGVETKCELIALPLDLREDWPKQLQRAGWDKTQKTLWLAEGLTMYLHEMQVMQLLERINTLAQSGDIFLFDILNKFLLNTPHMHRQLQFFESIGAPWHFGENEPEQMMDQYGWNARAFQAGEVAPARWPFPAVPRHVPNIPRGFYIEALRR